ncbi:MAG: hypothetical protein KKE50_00455 [Nanoarchaeota archaeon]|nr:hypothetical protein [Nanoarchaeota archaeon]
MEERIEQKVEKVEERVNREVERVVDKAVGSENLNKKEKEIVKEEVRKRVGESFLAKTKKVGGIFGSEFKNQTVIAITAAFGFLIALSWREPISEGINFLTSFPRSPYPKQQLGYG